MWCAADAGLVIAPDGARNQIEGGIIQGASFVMREQVRFEDGRTNMVAADLRIEEARTLAAQPLKAA